MEGGSDALVGVSEMFIKLLFMMQIQSDEACNLYNVSVAIESSEMSKESCFGTFVVHNEEF